MRYLIIFLLLFSVGCKSKKEYIYRDHVIDNTEIQHTKETIYKGSNSTTIIPCKEIDQVVELGDTKVTIKSIPEDEKDPTWGTVESIGEGSIKISIDQAPQVLKDSSIVVKNNESLTEKSKEIIYKKYVPKFLWYVLIGSLLLNLWSYRKPILVLIRKLLIKI